MSDEVKIEEAKYHSNVRIGNWNEEVFLEEDRIRQFLEKRNKGKLLVQQTRLLFSNFLKEIEIEAPCHYIRFGAIIQLIATDLPVCNGFPTGPMTLSMVVNEKSLHLCQKISDKSDLSVAVSMKPCIRNTFLVKSADKIDRNNELLKYGQDFYLQCVEAEKQPLVLFSSPKTMGLLNSGNCPNSFYTNGEINQAIGVCLQTDHCCNFIDCLPNIPPNYCRWRALHIIPNMRIETENQPVPSNSRLIINNSNTNKHLAAETIWTKTFFGPELGVCCQNYLDLHKREKFQNIWMFGTRTEE